MGMKRREHQRLTINIPTRIKYETDYTSELKEQMGTTKDLSLGGVRLEVSEIEEIEDVKKLEFKIPDLPVQIMTRGEIRWSSKHDGNYLVGIEFTSIPSSEQEALKRYLSNKESKGLVRKASLSQFEKFKKYIIQETDLAEPDREKISRAAPDQLYSTAGEVGLDTCDVSKMIAQFLNVDHLSNLDHEIADVQNLSDRFCRENKIAPLWGEGNEHVLVLSNPFRHICQSVFEEHFDEDDDRFMITDPDNIQDLFGQNGNGSSRSHPGSDNGKPMATDFQTKDGLFVLDPDENTDAQEHSSIEDTINDKFEDLKQQKEESRKDSIIRIVNRLLKSAVEEGVSDIHIEPRENKVEVRYRLDGVLKQKWEFPDKLVQPIVTRIKIMSDMDIAERRKPLDGGFRMLYEGRRIDVRTSTIPVNNGEKTVLRILDKKSVPESLSGLGFKEKTTNILENSLDCTKGILFFTGPTGSGKSTSMYTCLKKLYEPEVNIQTVENPIEYNVSGINQMEINSKAGLTYASALKGILRQDPDILMVGEIRDYETLDIAAKAAMSGHLVLSTLHTNDAPSTVNRLLNIGLDSYIVASTTQLIVAQRLLRRLCPECKEPVEDPNYYIEKYPIPEGQNPDIFQAEGCNSCNQVGYDGQMGVMECLPSREQVREVIRKEKGTDFIKKLMQNELGLNTLRENAFQKVGQGKTSVKEALRVSM